MNPSFHFSLGSFMLQIAFAAQRESIIYLTLGCSRLCFGRPSILNHTSDAMILWRMRKLFLVFVRQPFTSTLASHTTVAEKHECYAIELIDKLIIRSSAIYCAVICRVLLSTMPVKIIYPLSLCSCPYPITQVFLVDLQLETIPCVISHHVVILC